MTPVLVASLIFASFLSRNIAEFIDELDQIIQRSEDYINNFLVLLNLRYELPRLDDHVEHSNSTMRSPKIGFIAKINLQTTFKFTFLNQSLSHLTNSLPEGSLEFRVVNLGIKSHQHPQISSIAVEDLLLPIR